MAWGESKFRLEIRRILALREMKYLNILNLASEDWKSLHGFPLPVMNFTQNGEILYKIFARGCKNLNFQTKS